LLWSYFDVWEAFLTSTLTVAVAEIGDKTQLLSLVLTARFRRPVPVILGIIVATVLNHFVAAWAGQWLGSLVSAGTLQIIVGLSFMGMAVWALIPDKLDDKEAARATGLGAFLTTAVTFFLVEIGDKTQVATVALAAHYQMAAVVTIGTTLGMVLANAPVVWLGQALMARIPLKAVRWLAAALFFVLGLAILLLNGSIFPAL
jgi:putative Ca2+/H+ antiporter (TMEM165/GDT1 family)